MVFIGILFVFVENVRIYIRECCCFHIFFLAKHEKKNFKH
jgi:hypothetical protein